MSDEWEEDRLVCSEQLAGAVLPPNSCFETAFTSDEPITRIVPQSSVDTLCLPSRKVLADSGSVPVIDRSLKPKICPEKMVNKPLSKFKNRKKGGLRRTQSMAQLDASLKRNTLPRPTVQSYVNFGLSQSLDDLLLEEEADQLEQADLNFEEAMLSVNCLMRASRPPSPAPTLTSSIDSLSTVSSSHVNKTALFCIDSCLWFEDIQQKACQVFQCVLMFLSPVARTSLRMLLQFIDRLPVPPKSKITKTEMVYDLSAHILSPGPHSKNVYSHHLVLSVVYFLVDNCEFIFQPIPEIEVNKNREEPAKENRAVKVYCEQLTKNQFEDQGLTSSWLALAELLDQIINDKKMKSKEKKKRLKKFKEAYPHIYKQRFGGSVSNLTNTVHFR